MAWFSTWYRVDRHAAPLAFNLKLKTVYIASSYTKDDDVTCATLQQLIIMLSMPVVR